MALNELLRGWRRIGNGSPFTMRGEATGAGVVANAHGIYTDASAQGAIMVVSTAVAGVAPGTAISTTPPMEIWNPPSSGFILSILKVSVGLVSGTLGGGSLIYTQYNSQTTIPSTGTELVPSNALLGAPRGVGRTFQGSTLAGTPTIIRPAFNLGAFLNTTPTPAQPGLDLVDGEITVAPGTVFSVQGVAAAGSTPLVMIGVTYEEIPIV